MRRKGAKGARAKEDRVKGNGEEKGRGSREVILQRYLEEGVVALLPVYREEGAGETQVLTLRGTYRDCRSLSWLVELLARFYGLDLAAVRRRAGRQLELRHHILLPLAEGLVLLPVKVRKAGIPGETTTGYVNLLQVEKVATPRQKESVCGAGAGTAAAVEQSCRALFPVDTGEADFSRSRINCNGKIAICCLNTPATVRQKLQQGEAARQELLQRQKYTPAPPVLFRGLDGETLRELMPACRCFLRSLFILFLDSATPAGSAKNTE
ncbi:MAG TPA: hypothetical protein DCQ14_02895 [Firmicutes bacterium]|nr:hypothetical protein [Bacillota bacterium]